MSTVPAYSIRSLIHAYGGRTVLDIRHLDIARGQICAFVGPNGSGKTTLLSILALLLTPASGSVRLLGEEIAGRRSRELRRQVTLVHQKPVLFSTTVRNNIAYGLQAQGLPAPEIQRRVRAIIEEADLSSVAEKHGRKISGGEAQRAVLARALVLETSVILLDEPTNSLDEASRPVLRSLLNKARNLRGTTIVIATHDTGFVNSLADRVIRLEEGKLLER